MGEYDAMIPAIIPDAECVNIVHEILTAVDVGKFVIKVGKGPHHHKVVSLLALW